VWWRRRLLGITGGEAIFPLSVLFLLFFFDEFDTGAFNVLAPNIKRSFQLTDRNFALVVVVNLGIVLVLAMPVGHWGDRVKRVALVVVGAIVAGAFSFLTGVVTTLGLLVVVRLGNGIGRLVNDPIHTSLLTDYYKPFDRPPVFAAHRNAVQLGNIMGSALAGGIAFVVGWRVAFVVLMVPIVITALVATRLHEPERGGSDPKPVVPPGAPATEAAADNAGPPPVPFVTAVRQILGVHTLKRAYWGVILLGGGLVPLAVLLPLYLDRVYHLNEAQRGLVVSINGVATFAGMLKSGKWCQGWLIKGLGEPLRRTRLVLVLLGVQLALLAASPWLIFFLLLALVASFSAGVFLPPLLTVQALVSPARIRSLAFSFAAIFLVTGAALFFVSPLGTVSDDYGIRWGLFSSAPFWIAGGLIIGSAHRFVTDDTMKAMS
jgi:MFS family permease